MDFKKFALNNIVRNFRAYLGYFLSCSFSIMIFSAFAVSMFHPMIAESKMSSGSTAFMALMITEVIIFGFSMLFIIYSLGNFIKSRTKEFGILIIMGMSNKQFKKLILFENLIIGFLSICFGLILGLLLSKVSLIMLSQIFYMNLNSFYLPINAIIITAVVFIILFTITGPITFKLIKKEEMIELLKGNQKPKEEIKSSKIKGLLGIVLIIGAYFLIIFGDKIGINGGMYLMSFIMILGLYLFFSQFIVLVLNELKKKEKIYKNKTNMLLISNLVYKMKDNARLLFLITILLSGTLVALSTTNSLVSSQGETSKSNFPMVYSYFTEEGNPNENNELNVIKDTIKSYNYKEINFNILDDDFNIILSVDNYNKIAKELNLKTINLNKDEALLIPRYARKDSINSMKEIKECKIKNENLKVAGVGDKLIFPQGMFKSITVINDDLYSSIENNFKKIDFYGFNYDNWENTGELTNKLREENFSYEFDDPNFTMKSYFLTLPDMYLVELQQSKILQFMGISIGIVFFVAVLSFLYFRLFTDEELDKIKYENLSKIGLSYNEMRKIVSIEVGSLFLIPFFVSSINAIIALVFVNNVLQINTTISQFNILAIFFIIYIIYFIVVKNKYIKNIWNKIN